MTAVTDKVGSVSRQRYEQIVAELQDVVQQQAKGQFLIGDRALEIEPMRPHGGPHDAAPGEELLTVRESLFMLAEDIGLSYAAVEGRRWTASRWPADRRREDVSYAVHRSLAHIENQDERFEAIANPPLDERTGQRRWAPDQAKRRVGHQVAKPVTPQEKINTIHALARDDEVASKVTTDMLHRPEVAFRASLPDEGEGRVRTPPLTGQGLPGVEGPHVAGLDALEAREHPLLSPDVALGLAVDGAGEETRRHIGGGRTGSQSQSRSGDGAYSGNSQDPT